MSLQSELIAARKLIAKPKQWHRHEYADENDTAFCILGACIQSNVSWEAEKLLRAELPPEFNGMLTRFNDSSLTEHPDVLAVFDRAIKAAS
jgi:hypothetical protein